MPPNPRCRSLHVGGVLLLVAGLLAACARLQAPAPLPAHYVPVGGLGESQFEVTARDARARALFGHGLQLLYAFEHAHAARVFRAALAHDPECAMCAWGVALAQAPHINDDQRGPERDIRRHLALAQAAAAGVSPVERALIDALAVRYGRGGRREQRAWEARGAALCAARKAEREVHPQELAYMAAMTEVVQRFADHPDVVTLYADAVMTTSAWAWWDRQTGAPSGAMADVVARLHAAAERHPRHTGVLHFLIHAVEQSPAPAQAEAVADRLAAVAPGAPHLVHMPSHIHQHLGRFADATRSNQQALATQEAFDLALAAQGVQQRAGGWDRHHLHFLWYAALMEGRFGLALDTARTLSDRFGAAADGAGEYVRLLPALTLLRAQQWSELLAEPLPPPGLGVAEAFWHAARAVAQARLGRIEAARHEQAAFARLQALPTAQRARLFGATLPRDLMSTAGDWAAGEIARAEGRHAAAIEALRRAAERDDQIGGEPPMLAATGRLLLAGALLAAGRADEAAAETASYVKRYGPSAWSHQAEQQVALARGQAERARAAAQRAQAAWRAADRPLLPQL